VFCSLCTFFYSSCKFITPIACVVLLHIFFPHMPRRSRSVYVKKKLYHNFKNARDTFSSFPQITDFLANIWCLGEKWTCRVQVNISCSKLFSSTGHVKVVFCFIFDSYVINDAIMYIIILLKNITWLINKHTCPNARAVKGVGLTPLACWDCGFESHRGRGCLSVVSVVCCQVEVSATDWSLVQRSPTECGASLSVIYKPREWRVSGPLGPVAPNKINKQI